MSRGWLEGCAVNGSKKNKKKIFLFSSATALMPDKLCSKVIYLGPHTTLVPMRKEERERESQKYKYN